ncbi:MAG: hypothetical protein MK078_15115 [Crocinitomicaceae bacterium]|nr:hypothetical protein [Crocinitomicaceae bacterium]
MNRIEILLSLFALCGSLFSIAQDNKKELDKESIKSMCGCFEIDFDYTETFSPDTNYQFHKDYHAHADAEYAFVVEEDENHIVIQHLLIIGDEMIIKHWRQDWIYENTEFWEYDNDFAWKYVKKSEEEVTGQWTQKVYQVDDSPRYQGSGTWVHVDGKHYWESTSYSPLPRREYSKRSDYNILVRGNRHEVTDYGWLHEQDNSKLLRNENGDKILAQEKGYNKYYSQPVSKCQAAIEWWEKNEEFWAMVRGQWDVIFSDKKDLTMKKFVEEKMMWEEVFGLGSQFSEGEIKKKAAKAGVIDVIDKFTV